MLNKNKSREPLLYIQQPNWNFPVSDMQETYLIKKSEVELITNEVHQLPVSDQNGELDRKEGVSAVAIKEKEDNDAEPKLESNEKKDHQEVETENLIVAEKEIVEGNSTEKVMESTEVQKIVAKYEEERKQDGMTTSSAEKNNQTFSFKRIKGFKEMNTVEKVDYLVNFPKLLPPVPCVISTNNSSIRGFLISKVDEEIEVKTFDEKIIEIHMKDVNDIKIIGFK